MNPFLGPKWFDFADRQFFFGRDIETDQIASRLLSNRPVFVYGASGAGKSSILLAGVIPEVISQITRFHAGRSVIVVSNREWHQGGPLDSAQWHVLGDGAVSSQNLMSLPVGLSTFQQVIEYVTQAAKVDVASDVKPLVVLILDQLEDLWPRSYEADDSFVYLRASLASLVLNARFGPAIERLSQLDLTSAAFPPGVELAVAAGIRGDVLGLLDKLNEEIPVSFDDLYELPLLNVASARDAILRPLLLAGYTIDDASLDALLEHLALLGIGDAVAQKPQQLEFDVQAQRKVTPVRANEEVIIEPILLQIVMWKLVDDVAKISDKAILYPSKNVAASTARDIASNYFAERIMAVDKPLWRVRDLVLSSLVSSQARSIAKDADELLQDMLDRGEDVSPEQIDSVVKSLAEVRILRTLAPHTVHGKGQRARYELFHNLFALLARYRSEDLIASDRKRARLDRTLGLLTIVVAVVLSIFTASIAYILSMRAEKAREAVASAKLADAQRKVDLVDAKLIEVKREIGRYAPISILPSPGDYVASQQHEKRQLKSVHDAIENFDRTAKIRQDDVGGFKFRQLSATDGLFYVELSLQGRPKGFKNRNCRFQLTFDPQKWPDKDYGPLGASYSMISWGWDNVGFERPPVFSTNVLSKSIAADPSFVAQTCHRSVYAVIQPAASNSETELFKLDFCGMAQAASQPTEAHCRVDGL